MAMILAYVVIALLASAIAYRAVRSSYPPIFWTELVCSLLAGLVWPVALLGVVVLFGFAWASDRWAR